MSFKDELEESKQTIAQNMSGKSHSILVSRDETRNPGFRLAPWCKIYPKKQNKEEHLDNIKFELMSHGIGFYETNSGIVVKNISNCQLLLKLLDEIPEWWRRCLEMISEGKHRNPKNLLKIVKTKNKNSNFRGNTKWDVEKIKNVLEKD